MKKIMVAAVTAVTVFAGTMLVSSVAHAAVELRYQEKEIKIQKAKHNEEDKQVLIEVGEQVKFTIKIYQDQFYGQTIIRANADIKNRSRKRIKAIYSISFLDQHGRLVGCHQGVVDIGPTDGVVKYRKGEIYVDAKGIASVTSYQLMIRAVKF